MQLSNSFPPVDAALNKIKEFDYVKFGAKVVNYSVTVYAVLYAVITYIWTAFQLWWDDNGETVKVNLVRFTFNSVDFIAEIVFALQDLYRFLKRISIRLMDSVYFSYVFS